VIEIDAGKSAAIEVSGMDPKSRAFPLPINKAKHCSADQFDAVKIRSISATYPAAVVTAQGRAPVATATWGLDEQYLTISSPYFFNHPNAARSAMTALALRLVPLNSSMSISRSYR
jgi:hypothetical protein